MMKHTRPVPSFLTRSSLRLLIFGGKGGVGKTSCATATAMQLALLHPAQSTLLVSSDPAHSLKDCCAGFTPQANLKILELNTDHFLQAFKEKHGRTMKEIVLKGSFLDEGDIARFVELALPGMDEVLAFLEISAWIRELTYDRIIVDTAPTGHTLRLLAMPEFIRQWLETLNVMLAKHRYMKRQFQGSYQSDELDGFIEDMALSVQQMNDLFRNHEQCCFIPVMIAETLSVKETIDLMSALNHLKIGVGDIVVNRILPDNACPVCLEGRHRQMRVLAALSDNREIAPYRFWGVPLYAKEVLGGERLHGFWNDAWELAMPLLNFTDSPLVDRSAAVESPALRPSDKTSLIIFAGKGGVGKTTLASATALHLAKSLPEKEILLLSVNPAHSLSDCFNLKIGPSPVRLAPGLTAIELDAQAEFDSLNKEYQAELKLVLASGLPNLDLTFDRIVLERIFSLSPPGLDEMMALTLVMDYLAQGRYNLLILDAAPTGHLIRLLELPEIIDSWLKAFFRLFLKYRQIFHFQKLARRLVKMSKGLKSLRSILHDPQKSAIYGVSILTEMAFEETKDLVSKGTGLGIAVPALFLNLATQTGNCPFCAQISAREGRLLGIYRNAFPRIQQTIVYRRGEPRGVTRLEDLGDRLYGDGYGLPRPEQSQGRLTTRPFMKQEAKTGV